MGDCRANLRGILTSLPRIITPAPLDSFCKILKWDQASRRLRVLQLSVVIILRGGLVHVFIGPLISLKGS